MSAKETASGGRAPWLLTGPALLLFIAIVLVPIVMTGLLSFYDWGQYKGIETSLHAEELARDRNRLVFLPDIPAYLPHRASGHRHLGADRCARSLYSQPHGKALAELFPRHRARPAADLGRGADARLGAVVRLNRARQVAADVASTWLLRRCTSCSPRPAS